MSKQWKLVPSVIVGAVVLAVAVSSAQTPQAPAAPTPTAKAPPAAALPSARSVIDRHLGAIGGRAAMAARKSTRATGTISIPSAGITGSIEVLAARPGKMLHRVSLPGVGDTEEGYDGTVGWSVNPMTGPRLLQGDELVQRREDANFDAEFHADDLYKSMTVTGKTTFDGREVYTLALVLESGREVTEFYEVGSGLQAGVIRTDQTPMGPITSTVSLGDYRKFGPLLQPTTMKISAMGIDQVVTLDKFEFDTVSDSAFALPPAIQALVK